MDQQVILIIDREIWLLFRQMVTTQLGDSEEILRNAVEDALLFWISEYDVGLPYY